MKKEEKAVLDAMKKAGKPVRPGDVAKAVKLDSKEVSKIISLLKAKGARVEYNDPYVPRSVGHREYPGLDLRSVPLTARRLRGSDAVIIATNHSSYDYEEIVRLAPLVVDTRNAVGRKRRNVIKA